MDNRVFFKKDLLEKFKSIKDIKKYNNFHDFLIDNQLIIISKSNLFDSEWYVNQYPDVKVRKLDPILHYCTLGIYENCNPNSSFDSRWYLDYYSDVNKVFDNPFLHYVVFGIEEGRFTNSFDLDSKNNDFSNNHLIKLFSNPFNSFSSKSTKNIIEALSKKVSIIVPIYNAYDDTVMCINKVFENTFGNYELILIDDNSPDKRISEFLDTLEGKDNIKIIRNKENLGFVRNVNLGIQNSDNDVILLNSDTKVTPKWLQKLTVSAYMEDNIGTVTPLSNNAGAFSVPEIGKVNDIPPNLTLNEMANIVEKSSARVFMEVPTGNGFCMYIKRDTINSVGLFDFENFGKGYCEENDFCMRAIDKGWVNIIDDTTYIYHKKGASFSEKREKLIKEHRKILDVKHPSYTKQIRDFLKSDDLGLIHSNLDKYLTNYNKLKLDKKRILYVLHKGLGGTPQTNKDLMSIVEKGYDCYLLTSDRKNMFLEHLIDGKFKNIKKWSLTSEWLAENNYIEEYKNIYFEILINYSIDLVHIRNLINHSFDLPSICGLLNVPLVLSFHDFYFICPDYTLIDGDYQYCAGVCTKNNKNCYAPMRGFTNIPNMKNYVDIWRESVFKMFSNVNHFVTTSQIVKDMFLDTFPLMSEENFSVIEHGRDFNILNEDLFEIPSLDKPIKILFIGNTNTQKGSKIIKKLHDLDKNSKLEIHFLGKTAGDLKDVGIKHGEYVRDELPKYIKEIKPSFIGIFSIWSETYCHTLSEAWACGIPVLSTQIGVLEDRVKCNGGGWFIDHENPQKTYDLILNIAKNEKDYLNKQKETKNIKFKSINDMGIEYLNIYDNLIRG